MFRTIALASTAASLVVTGLTGVGIAAAAGSDTTGTASVADTTTTTAATDHKPVHIDVFAPEKHSVAGVEGRGWFVDMEVDFNGIPLRQTGFTGLQLTGPGVHANAAPFPGAAAPGQDDRMPGLVVLASTTNADRPGFSGPGTNLAGLFNLTGVTNRTPEETELWDTWIVGAAIAGTDVDSTLTVAEVGDLNHNGVFDDAPGVVKDLNGDGRVDAADLRLLGVASNVVTVPFHISGAPA